MMTAPGRGQQVTQLAGGQPVQRRRLCAGNGLQQPAATSCCSPRVANGAIDVHRHAVLAGGLAQPQEHDRRLVFRFEPDQHDHRCRFQVGVADRHRAARDAGRQELGLLGRVRPGAEVDVVGVQHDSRELGVRVGVLPGRPAADQHTRAPAGRLEALGGRHRSACDHDAGCSVPSASRIRGVVMQVRLGRVRERPAALVAVPFLVDLGVVAGQPAQHLAAAVVGALRRTRRAVLAHARAGHQVERAGPEPVGGAGQRADRADLHGVAGEVGVERLVGVDADLLQRTAFQHFDERVAGDLVGEPRAPGAQHAALAVQQHLRRRC